MSVSGAKSIQYTKILPGFSIPIRFLLPAISQPMMATRSPVMCGSFSKVRPSFC